MRIERHAAGRGYDDLASDNLEGDIQALNIRAHCCAAGRGNHRRTARSGPIGRVLLE
jgi:hypothetical protein